jgi:phage terminase small subunit
MSNTRRKTRKPARHALATSASTSIDGPAPIVLTGERRRLWDDIRSRFSLEPASENILRNACEALERAAQAAEQVNREGPTVSDRFGAIRAHPMVAVERDFRGLAARQLQQLAARMEGD